MQPDRRTVNVERFISRITLPMLMCAALVGMWWYIIHRLIDGLAKAMP